MSVANERFQFMQNLEGLSLDAVKEISWRHYARSTLGLVACEVCEGPNDMFDPGEEGGSDIDGVNFCGVHWAEIMREEAASEI